MMPMLRCGLFIVSILGMTPHAAAMQLDKMPMEVSNQGLVLMHIPYNFGHSVEMLMAMQPEEFKMMMANKRHGYHGGSKDEDITLEDVTFLNDLAYLQKPSYYEPWGHLNPDLFAISNVTGHPLYFTPQKYWPEKIARAYFGNKTIFGMLRDPYERLVSQFRGDFKDYGAFDSKFVETCDVNGAIKKAMKHFIANGDKFASQCTFLPQAEYFDGPYGIQLAIDNRRIPTSINEALEAYGYIERLETESVMHVAGCDNVWAGDLDSETKDLVRKVYARDFELLCSKFGYCDDHEYTCIRGVENMCPEKLFKWDKSQKQYVPK